MVLTNEYVDKYECDQDIVGDEPDNGCCGVATVTLNFRTVGFSHLQLEAENNLLFRNNVLMLTR